MQLAHRVSLNGAELDDVDPRIIIKGVEGGAGKDTVSTAASGSGDGTRVTGKRRDSLEVAVKFSMNIRRDVIEERGQVLEAIGMWASAGGWLRINYKPGRRLYIDEVVFPGEGDLWKRLSEYTVTLRAHAIPYWQEENAASATTSGSGTSGSGVLTAGGSARTKAEATLANKSGAEVTGATITIGGKKMTFSALGMMGGESLVIDHAVSGGKEVIRIRIRNTSGGYRSVMAKRTADSADEFEIARGGDVAFSFTSTRACQLTASVRGRFL